MNKFREIIKKILGTIALPAIMFMVMYVLTHMSGKAYYGTWPMFKALIVDTAVMIVTAFGIGLQFKSGRFDFSGGGIMLVAGILAGKLSVAQGNNMLVYIGVALTVCIVLSMLVALVYVFGRLPIIIATIGMALLFESMTTLMYNGSGVNLVANMTLRKFAMYPYVLIPLTLGFLIYGFYSKFTTVGKQAILLSNNQKVAVHIGINEKKNVFITYIYSGVLFGLATMLHAPMGIQKGAFTSLVTVGSLFSNILPVFIGLMLVKYCGDTIGIVMGSITLTLMSYGLTAIFDAKMGAAISVIITGLFIFSINVLSARGRQWIETIRQGLLKTAN